MASLNLEQARQYIDDIDFTAVYDKLTRDDILRPYGYKWAPQEAEIAISNYKKFLYILVKYHKDFDTILPTLEIDEIWHNHILDTEKYINDCDVLFGRYYHHYPYFGIDDQQIFGISSCIPEKFQLTQRLFLIEYGEILDATPKKAPPQHSA